MITEGVGNKEMECGLETGFLGHCSRAQPDLCNHKESPILCSHSPVIPMSPPPSQVSERPGGFGLPYPRDREVMAGPIRPPTLALFPLSHSGMLKESRNKETSLIVPSPNTL